LEHRILGRELERISKEVNKSHHWITDTAEAALAIGVGYWHAALVAL